MSKVAILGGGVAGMSAAHELIERGFEVEVYERDSIAGGKARSFSRPGTGAGGRKDLPGEHGFRFFPGFYRHVTDTMQRIPFQGQVDGVLGNLVQATRVALATQQGPMLVAPAEFPRNLSDLRAIWDAVRQFSKFGMSPEEIYFFINRLLVVATCCDERRLQELEPLSWWDFTDAANRSKNFQRFFAIGMTRCTVACRAEETSTRTSGTILLQLLFGMVAPGKQVDRLLNGPTNDVWIDPWLAYLTQKGVAYHNRTEVQAIRCEAGQIAGVTVLDQNGAAREVAADFYIAALPVEVMQRLLNDQLCAADPALAQIRNLTTAWMNGCQFYLTTDLPIDPGHTVYIDSPWALTSISQNQFWRKKVSGSYGNGAIGGILSVDISNWEEPGILYGLPAQKCTREQIRQEVWAQMKAHLNLQGQAPMLIDGNVADWGLDPDILLPPPGSNAATQNTEPLLINTKGSWKSRPTAATKIKNFFLASDYIQTHTDLATMEGANEAARAAVNALLDACGSSAPKCRIWPLSEPEILARPRNVDQELFEKGLENPLDVSFAELINDGGKAKLQEIRRRAGLEYFLDIQDTFELIRQALWDLYQVAKRL